MKKLIMLGLILVCLSSCTDEINTPPYIISVPVSKNTSNPPYYNHGGLEFSLSNKTTKPITKIDISCFVYSSSDGKNPFSGSNRIRASFGETIDSGETKKFAVSLDSRLCGIPPEPFIIDFLTVPKIVFSDGTIWTDPVCQFFTRSSQ